MCLHYSFEKFVVKSPNYKQPRSCHTLCYNLKDLYCDGSRNHGCNGCFCRYVNLKSHHEPCLKCGKMLYDLCDRLWNIRRKAIASLTSDFDYNFREIFFTFYKIDEALKVNLNSLGNIKRSDLIRLYESVVRRITKKYLEALYVCKRNPNRYKFSQWERWNVYIS